MMETTPTHLTLVATTKTAPTSAFPRALLRTLALARVRLEVFWRALVSCARREPKSLVVSETTALGDRRLVAVVRFERQRFLIGSSPSSVTLLARLPDAGPATETGATAATTNGASQ